MTQKKKKIGGTTRKMCQWKLKRKGFNCNGLSPCPGKEKIHLRGIFQGKRQFRERKKQ